MTRRTAAWLAWSLCAACLALIALALLLDFLTPESILFSQAARPDLGFAILTGVLSLAYPTVGALIASRLPTNPIGWIFCGVGLLYAARRFTIVYTDYALTENFALLGGEYVAWFSTWVAFPGLILAGVFLMLLFPDGQVPSRWWRIVAWAAVLGAALTALADALTPGPLDTHPYVDNPFRVVGVIGGGFTTYDLFAASAVLGSTLLLTSSFAALFSLFLRLYRARGDERQQLKWFLYAAVPATVCISLILFQSMVYKLVTDFLLFNNVAVLTWVANCRCEAPNFVNYFSSVAVVASLVVPVCTYIAILRYHLYDIDRIINRTLVYGALSAIVVGTYVLVVGGMGALLQAQDNLLLSILSAGLVAILFQPLRIRLQRSVNRLMYGQRDEPYAVLSHLGRRLESTLAPEEALSTIVDTVVQALKLPYAAIALRRDRKFVTAAEHGQPSGELEVLPLVYQSEEVGRLVVEPRTPGEAFAPADKRLLDDLAHQAGAAAHATRLTADLQSSRERLVNAREEERRRLRRDLHDGLGPTLGGLTLGLDTARGMVTGKSSAERLLVRLKEESQEAVSDVRRLVYGLRPPALDDLGLVAAIRQQAAKHGRMADSGRPRRETGENGPHFSVKAPEPLPPLPAAVEVACYRIAQEAMTNVARHAQASSCSVSLSIDEATGVLELEVIDDGVGMPENRRAGVGMTSMRERAEELGGTLTIEPIPEGGTRILAHLPLPAAKEEKRSELGAEL
jgi:signal transduction histidine kinase